MPSSQEINDYVVEPALVGAGLAAGAAWWFQTGAGVQPVVSLMGSDYKLWALVGGLGVATAIAMNYVDNQRNGHLPQDRNILTHPEATLTNIVGSTAMLLGAEAILSPGVAQATWGPMVGISAAAIIGGQFLAQNYVMPYIDNFRGGSSHGY